MRQGPIELSGREATEALGARLARQGYRFVALEGPLGAGKTTLARGYMAALGADPDEVHSPSYALVHEYELARGYGYHLDLYRLESDDDLESIGYWDVAASGAPICVEWPSVVPGAWVGGGTLVTLEGGSDRGRIAYLWGESA